MAFFQMIGKSFETVGHGIATGATALADEITGGNVPEIRHARQDQERRLQEAARRTEESARVVGGDVNRVLGTVGVSALTLSRIVTSPEQLRRLVELIETHDFLGLIRALQNRAEFPDDFFPNWIRRAGGYFPKFAQVLSVRADLIHNRRVLDQLSRCLEDMPARDRGRVHEFLQGLGWDQASLAGLGEALNAGTIAQVNELRLPDGRPGVVKATFPDTRRQVQTDFRLFEHARNILRALNLEDEQARTVGVLFAAVGKNEPAVMNEFDLQAEAIKLATAGELAAGEWPHAYGAWLGAASAILAAQPPALAMLATQWLRNNQWRVRVPEPVAGLCSQPAIAMTRAGGESIHRLLSGSSGDAGRQEAAGALLGLAVPFIGWMLLCKSTQHFGHVDPHPGNFRWCAAARELWVLDWGSSVTLSLERRKALCMLIRLVADDAEPALVGDVAGAFGLRGTNPLELAKLVRGMLNATTAHAAQDAINTAAIDNILDGVSDDVVPVVRCLSVLGGMLKELQQHIRSEHQHEVPLSLAALWGPFATLGLAD
uniref:ABC1 atypical kinase-like domain-containing protein n=1 Tax=Alexandrium monilatum TaxID=311494 RepID=A0A7S4VJF1_9DINO